MACCRRFGQPFVFEPRQGLAPVAAGVALVVEHPLKGVLPQQARTLQYAPDYSGGGELAVSGDVEQGLVREKIIFGQRCAVAVGCGGQVNGFGG